MHILIVSKSNLKLQVLGLFSRFVRTLIIKISSSEEPENSRSIRRVGNVGKLVILFHPSPRSITKRCRSLSSKWRRTRRTNFLGACAILLIADLGTIDSGKMSAHTQRISRFRGAICDSSVDEVCLRTSRTSFYTFWD